MRCERMGWLGVIALLGAQACGGDSQPLGQAPEAFERELPELGGPGVTDAGPIDSGPTHFELEDAGPCCALTFALPQSSDGEERVVLRGSHAPLSGDEGILLELVDTTWTADVCMPQDYDGTYYFELELPTEGVDGGVSDEDDLDDAPPAAPFIAVAYDETQPTSKDPVLGTVNVLEPRDSCD